MYFPSDTANLADPSRPERNGRDASGNIAATIICLLAYSILLAACSRELDPVNYGVDTGRYCRMTIVEPRFATSILTAKGRTLKFDAVECMANYVLSEENKADTDEGSQFFVSIDENGTMTAVGDAWFIISDSIRTPMGGGIVAYASEQPGAMRWSQILSHFREMSGALTPH